MDQDPQGIYLDPTKHTDFEVRSMTDSTSAPPHSVCAGMFRHAGTLTRLGGALTRHTGEKPRDREPVGRAYIVHEVAG